VRLQLLAGPGGIIGGGPAARDDVEGAVVGALALDERGDLAQDLRRHLDLPVDDGERVDAVPAGGAAERRLVRPEAADPERDARLLQRSRPEDALLHRVMLAAEAERLPAPEAREHGQRLVEPGGEYLRVG